MDPKQPMRNNKAGDEDTMPEIPTERFSAWLLRTRRAQNSKEGASVPCGDCRGCCTSSYFIHIRPEEKETLARIPRKLIFKAPGMPKGHVLLGYGENGHCPLFIGNRCSIYAHRPQTCRDYDCRIFPATGIGLGEEKPLISRQADRWAFGFGEAEDRMHFTAVRAAAKFLDAHAESFPPGFVPRNPTQRAVVALKVYEAFLGAAGGPGKRGGESAVPARVEAVVARYAAFESASRAPEASAPPQEEKDTVNAMKGTLRTCKNGHRFRKSSDCPVCPVCEAERKPETGFLSGLSAPARRALENAGIKTLKQLSRRSEAEILEFHGMGPVSIPKLRAALKSEGLSFRKG
jgi:uncharacterized protein